MAHFDEGATGSVEAVRFSVLTREEVRKQSFVKITDPNLLNNVGQPIPGGPYDPALGPLQERTPCKSCGQSSFNCPGHCGHIELVSPVYNPVLFSTLCSLLRKTCLFCHHLNAGPSEVKKCVSKLELIAKGDVARVRDLDDGLSSESSDEEDNAGSKYHGSKHLKQQKWTSLQFTEAMSVWKNLPRPKRYEGCGYCGEDIVKIRSPTFGWICKVKKNENTADTKEFGLQGAPADEELLHEERIIKNVRATSTQIRDSKRDKGLGQNLKEREPVSLVPLLPSEVKEIVRLLWENEAQLLTCISDIQRQGFGEKADHLMFFLETLLVPPIKFRPPSKGGDSVMEHPHTFLLSKVLQANIDLGNAHINKLESSKIIQRWMDLQQCINVMFDSKKAAGKRNVPPGICQLLEKKEGLFRQKMMGKRVNFSCRSVISPDPYLAVNEIGIPPHFALRLTYPERVTPWNAVKLRDAIVNGPEVHPGATHYIDKSTTVKLPLSRKARISISRKLLSSRGVVIQDGNNIDHEFEGKIVYRHLQDGDMVLVNRQPTLHKPSIMAHVVRVLKGEKTIRMHYANCSTYNADFDGDEMNVHFPQDEISRAEGYTILNANNQYLKPTSGEPIRALIQDHIVSAVLLTKKDTFLRWDEFNQLLYSTGLSSPGSGASSTEFGTKVFESGCEAEFQSLLPAIWKPEPLWTGKQVITALLNHITRGFLPFTVEKGGRIPRDFFNTKRVENEPSRDADKDELRMMEELDEDKLLVYRNNIVRGVIDKAQFGEYGLVHMVQELYGSNAAGLLLSAFSRLFTAFLQMHGFTCGVDDLLLVESKDRERKRQLEKCEEIGEEVHRRFVGIEDDETIDPCTLQLKIEKDICTNGEAALASLDRKMISRLNDITSKSEELEGLLSDGLLKPPSKNCISLMTTSGAKGGVVNFQQISSHLGQQELEGKRVPRMVSGKTLPCFPPWDWASRSGGLVVDRFLSGLRPQEFYFHCMAGREGLVDTAVKTSRSGYLQRCLVKNLESLKVNYDHTVRDADGSIVQFLYGEDGVDVHQTSFLSKLETLAKNEEMITKNCCRQVDKSNPYIEDLPSALKKKAVEFVDKLSSKQNRSGSHQGDFLKLVEHKYLSSLAQPGESVGVLAAQSVGEPSTQMTLNTFHLAGRGEANVTLGIPRLQEILMRASTNLKTPIMTCPLQEGKSEEDAKNVAFKLSKITVADIIESMQVTVEPFSCTNGISRAYKLEMKIYDWISSKDWENTLLRKFEKQLRSAVKKHLKLIRRVNGIKHFLLISQSKDCKEGDDDFSSSGEESEDLGLDAQKRKQQVTDEMDYGDYSEEEVDEENPSAGFGGENDKGKNEKEFSEDDENEILDAKDGQLESPLEVGGFSKSKSPEKKIQSRSKETTLDGFNFTVHFTFPTHEPHIMLAQIAQDTAKKVYIEQYGGINYCRNITCKENQVFYYGKDPKCKEDIPLIEKEKIPALQTSGVDIATFCELQDILDVRYIYSNDIHAILHTYGVEAARETIIREITNVFKSYGISVDIRHLTLIADFMTRTGRYRPMSRFGGVAESISPFSKMSFETATKFIVEAAFHREMDDLESPSARICLGLPVKVGTGCFDLMHKMEV